MLPPQAALPLRLKGQDRATARAGAHTTFEAFGLAGDIVARKCGVPVLYRFEVFGTPDDVVAVNSGLEAFWTQQLQTSI